MNQCSVCWSGGRNSEPCACVWGVCRVCTCMEQQVMIWLHIVKTCKEPTLASFRLSELSLLCVQNQFTCSSPKENVEYWWCDESHVCVIKVWLCYKWCVCVSVIGGCVYPTGPLTPCVHPLYSNLDLRVYLGGLSLFSLPAVSYILTIVTSERNTWDVI